MIIWLEKEIWKKMDQIGRVNRPHFNAKRVMAFRLLLLPYLAAAKPTMVFWHPDAPLTASSSPKTASISSKSPGL